MKQELKVAEGRKGELAEFVARLNKRAEKLGIGGVRLTWGETVSEPDKRNDPKGDLGLVKLFSFATVEGEEPVLAGWSFRAAIDHLPTDDGRTVNILRVRPGFEMPEKYRTTSPDCDHCHTARRRNKTYVLEHEDGRTVQIGSSCLRDFLGGDLDPELAARYEAELFDLGREDWCEDGDSCPRARSHWDLLQVVTIAAACVRVEGWVSRKQADNTYPPIRPTSGTVSDYLSYDHIRASEQQRQEHAALQPTAADKATAEAAVAWAAALGTGAKALSDYEWNLMALTQAGIIGWRQIGLAASLSVAYQREMGREIERRHAVATSKHFGTVGKREVFELTVVRINTTEGAYGTTWILGLVDAAGNQAVWFSSKNPEREGLDVGVTKKVKGTVKAHGSYKGIAQTTLTRCTVVEG